MNSDLGRKFASAAFIIGLFLLWEVLCLAFHVSDVILPRPSQVFITLWQRAPALWPHTIQTLYTTMLGFVLGVIIGVIIGVIVGWSKLAYDVAYPLLVGFSSVPKVAVVPILVLYLGSGTVPAVITALITSGNAERTTYAGRSSTLGRSTPARSNARSWASATALYRARGSRAKSYRSASSTARRRRSA